MSELTAERFGYPIKQFAAPDDSTRDPNSVLPQQVYEIDLLQGNKVIILKEDYDAINADSGVYNAASFREAVLAKKHAKSEEWQSERGPASELGRRMEEGTPPVTPSE